MPTYEYACTNCGHRFDVRQRFSDDPISDCPKCGASVRRVLYPAGVIFKGSGWYATDNRKGSASHSSSSSTDSSTSSDSESKAPATTSDKSDKKAKSAAADD
jgi:putative FmdB family regulatory protein